MTLNRIPAYIEVVTHGDDPPVTGSVTAVEADGVVGTAIRRGYRVEPTEHGVLVLRRPTARIVVELRPVCRPAPTRSQAQDLSLLAGHRSAHLRARPEGLLITAGIARIPPAAARRLLGRGWVGCLTVQDGEPVSVSVAGRVALALRQHRTRSTHPRGWHFAADNPHGPQVVGRDRHGGRLYDGSSRAVCSCGWSQFAERRPQAAHAARQHRLDSVIAALSP
jgi:hypothetical protein